MMQKKIGNVIIAVCGLFIFNSVLKANTLPITVGIIINNEEYGILDTIQPLIENNITQFIIIDTQQAPVTIQLLQDHLQTHAIVPIILNGRAKDEGLARNQLISTAEHTFPDSNFLLMPCAGWQLRNAHKLIEFCKDKERDTCSLYYVRFVQDATLESYQPCLVRCKAGVVFNGFARAVPSFLECEKVAEDIFFEQYAVYYGIVSCKEHLIEEQKLLLDEYHHNPDNARVLYELAQISQLLGESQRACFFYEQCSHTFSASEEKFLALYFLGNMTQSMEQKDSGDSCPLAMHYYLKAHETCPDRAEPLVKLAQYYALRGNVKMAYFFAYKAAFLEYPHNSILPVEKDVYTFTRYDLLGQYAWYVGEYTVGEWAIGKALEYNPDQEHLKRNLQFYSDRHSMSENLKKGFGVSFIGSMQHGNAFNRLFLENDVYAKKLQEHYYRCIVQSDSVNILHIPKIIHQIWLGGPLPLRCKALRASWLKHHPDWEYRLWTDKDIDQLKLVNKQLYDAALTYGEKADIARYEILYAMGGLYIDTDFECVQPFDELHERCDFYAGTEGGDCLVGNSLIGAAPGHPIIKTCIETLQGAQPGQEGWQYICDRTGPGHITRAIKKHIIDEDPACARAVVLPAGYFFPWYPYFGQVRTAQKALDSIKPETFAIHHWHSSWVK